MAKNFVHTQHSTDKKASLEKTLIETVRVHQVDNAITGDTEVRKCGMHSTVVPNELNGQCILQITMKYIHHHNSGCCKM